MTRYLADCAPGDECSRLLTMGWELDGQRVPTAWLIPLVWRRAWEPIIRPRGMRRADEVRG